jgi:protein-S-isoprenylcysteine O-methyltransferase Ste14
METIASAIIFWSWLLFLAYWIFNALKVKAVAERQDWRASLVYKVPTALGAALLLRQRWPESLRLVLTPQDNLTAALGAVLCVAGLMVAIWARRTLAGNWSSNVTFKQGHELIKTGPYRFARHPIYTGLLLMCLGTALAGGRLHSWLGLVLMFTGFWIKLKGEEALMMRHFPDQYPAYRQQVKAVVPFIL